MRTNQFNGSPQVTSSIISLPKLRHLSLTLTGDEASLSKGDITTQKGSTISEVNFPTLEIIESFIKTIQYATQITAKDI